MFGWLLITSGFLQLSTNESLSKAPSQLSKKQLKSEPNRAHHLDAELTQAIDLKHVFGNVGQDS